MWSRVVGVLESELSAQQVTTWIKPLKSELNAEELVLLAPNRFVVNWIDKNYRSRIQQIVHSLDGGESLNIEIRVDGETKSVNRPSRDSKQPLVGSNQQSNDIVRPPTDISFPNPTRQSEHLDDYNFERFVAGRSNQVARAAAQQVAEQPGLSDLNPLFIYGGVGLGKTHLMVAAGNAIRRNNPEARVVYVHAEKFVTDMVRALQHSTIDQFKRYYRSADALLMDDIQFLGKKERSQEEFFHTFNALLERRQQVIMTCDRYPRDMENLEERLKSRFGWGLTVSVDPPELETRAAILKSKAEESSINLDDDVAMFIATKVRSNVRELEGALKKVLAQANFTGRAITVDFATEALRDLLASQAKTVTCENIQRTVAEFYKVRQSDLMSPKRTRSIAWPRQVAMALSKELTNLSLPEIGRAFGGRDHTTVLHAVRKVIGRYDEEPPFRDEFESLKRILTN